MRFDRGIGKYLTVSVLFVLLSSCGGGGGDTGPSVPIVSTTVATSTTTTGAALKGTVNPNGVETNYWFEYGTDNTLTTRSYTDNLSAGSGSASIEVPPVVVSPLEEYSTYYFRIVASNIYGTVRGAIRSFPTGVYYVALGDSITLGVSFRRHPGGWHRVCSDPGGQLERLL